MTLMLWENALQKKASDLHGDTWQITFDGSIEPDSADPNWHKYISGAFAWFTCSLCKRDWQSKRVNVVFHFCLDRMSNQGTIKVRRYKQKCKKCPRAHMENPDFSEENIDILVGKLVRNISIKCYKENLGDRNRAFQFSDISKGPHESTHCEACRDGICRQADLTDKAH